MPSAPERYVDWVNHHVGFNPRGQSHSDELTRSAFADLRERCPGVAQHFMTAHGKARTNRHKDARAYAAHVHSGSPSTIAAFTIVINTALTYRNPDAFSRTAKSSGTKPESCCSAHS